MGRRSGKDRWVNGLHNATLRGIAAAQDPAFEERHCPYKMWEHRTIWLEAFRKERSRIAGVTRAVEVIA